MPRDGSEERPRFTISHEVKTAEVAPRSDRAVAACNVEDVIGVARDMPDATTRQYKFNQWLSDHGENCSKQELRELREFGRTLSLSDDVLSLIDYYLDQ
jgi:hypothetical protein